MITLTFSAWCVDERGDAVQSVRRVRAAGQREDHVAADRCREAEEQELRLCRLHEPEGCGKGNESYQ